MTVMQKVEMAVARRVQSREISVVQEEAFQVLQDVSTSKQILPFLFLRQQKRIS